MDSTDMLPGIEWSDYVERVEDIYDQLLTWHEAGKLGAGHLDLNQVPPNSLDNVVIKLLGYSDARDLMDHWDADKARRIAQQLSGPYGWSIYKAMQARQ